MTLPHLASMGSRVLAVLPDLRVSLLTERQLRACCLMQLLLPARQDSHQSVCMIAQERTTASTGAVAFACRRVCASRSAACFACYPLIERSHGYRTRAQAPGLYHRWQSSDLTSYGPEACSLLALAVYQSCIDAVICSEKKEAGSVLSCQDFLTSDRHRLCRCLCSHLLSGA